MQYTTDQLEQKKQDIIVQLKLKSTPVNLSPKQTSDVTHVATATLAVWRSTGRYNLPYVKVSRMVAYPLSAVAEFLLKREVRHTGEVLK